MPQQKKEEIEIHKHHMRGSFVPGSYNEAERTVDVVFATDTPVLTSDWDLGDYYEILSFENGHIRTARINANAPLLDSHKKYEGVSGSLGVVVSGSVKFDSAKRQGTATIKLSGREDERMKGIRQDVKDGIIKNISVGYDVFTYQRDQQTISGLNNVKGEGEIPTLVAIDWEPKEISLVLIPADIKAGIRSEDEKKHKATILNSENNTMTEKERIAAERKRAAKINEAVEKANLPMSFARTLLDNDDATEDKIEGLVEAEKVRVAGEKKPAPAPVDDTKPGTPEHERSEIVKAERFRVAEIKRSAKAAKVDEEFTEKLIADGTPLDQARVQILEKFVSADPHTGSRNIQVGKEDIEKKRELQEVALEMRANPGMKVEKEIAKGAREFRGMSLIDMAREAVEAAGGKVRGLSPREIARAALNLERDGAGMHSTSDFPIILGNTIGRVLRREYEQYPQTFKPFCNQSNVTDFKEKTVVQIGDLANKFTLVAEGGEYKFGTLGEAKESYRALKYGQKLAITWETLVNDDLGAFSRLPKALAMKAAQLESDIVWGILLDNPAMADGVALFHATHKNLANAAAIDTASLQASRKLMRNQKTIGDDFMNLRPAFILVGPDKELEAAQFCGTDAKSVMPIENADINPAYNRALTTIVEPRITGNLWFTAASPSQIDTIEYAYLEGENGLFVEQRNGFDVDGIEIKARLVFAAKAIDHRGLTKNPGA